MNAQDAYAHAHAVADAASFAYLRLKTAQQLYGKPPVALDAPQVAHVDRVCAHQQAIEVRILASPEAAAVGVDAQAARRAVDEISGRYADADEFAADIARYGLDLALLERAIERELTVAAVLDRVAAPDAEASATEVEIFYLVHCHRFQRTEQRTLRHILVTINDALPDNRRAAALARIEAIRARLDKSPRRFAEQAYKHSECPTAMNGGDLGAVKPGDLYPEIEAAAFALSPGELSAVVESPLGFHVLQCVAIEGGGVLPLSAVEDRIRASINETRRQAAQKQWIAALFQSPAGD